MLTIKSPIRSMYPATQCVFRQPSRSYGPLIALAILLRGESLFKISTSGNSRTNRTNDTDGTGRMSGKQIAIGVTCFTAGVVCAVAHKKMKKQVPDLTSDQNSEVVPKKQKNKTKLGQ